MTQYFNKEIFKDLKGGYMGNAGLIDKKKDEEQKTYTLFDPDQKIPFLQKFRLFFVKSQFSIEFDQKFFFKILGKTVFHLKTEEFHGTIPVRTDLVSVLPKNNNLNFWWKLLHCNDLYCSLSQGMENNNINISDLIYKNFHAKTRRDNS